MLDTLILWRRAAGDSGHGHIAGNLVLEFANGKTDVLPLRFGKEIVGGSGGQINRRFRSSFYAGSIFAPDGLPRQRFAIPGKDRIVSSLRLEAPAEAPPGCLFLFAVSFGSLSD